MRIERAESAIITIDGLTIQNTWIQGGYSMLLGANVELNLYNIYVNNIEMHTTRELDA